MESPDYVDIITLVKMLNAPDQEIYDKLKDTIDIEYRSSLFEALKRIKDAGLVENYYDDEDNQIKYKPKYKNFSIETMTLARE